MTRPHDIRLRLVTALATVVAVAALSRPAPALLAAAVLLGLFPATGRAIPWRRLVHLEAFLLLLLLTLPFAVPGRPVLTLGPFSASAEGLARVALLAGKVTASVLLIGLLLGAADPVRIGGGLRALGLPERFVRLFVTTARYLGLVGDEFRRLLEAMRARAFRPRSNRHTWRSTGWLLGMLLVRAMDRAERIEEAMLLRGGGGRILPLRLAAPGGSDWAAVLLWAGAAALLLAWDVS